MNCYYHFFKSIGMEDDAQKFIQKFIDILRKHGLSTIECFEVIVELGGFIDEQGKSTEGIIE